MNVAVHQKSSVLLDIEYAPSALFVLGSMAGPWKSSRKFWQMIGSKKGSLFLLLERHAP
jgi:hypothetical protein